MLNFDKGKQDVLFSTDRITSIAKFCNAIYDNSRKLGVDQDVQDKKRTGREVNLQGMAAEIWFKERYQIPYSLEITEDAIKPRSYLEDIDVQYKDLIFEIKQTTYSNGCLFLRPSTPYHKERKILGDIYVLVVGSFPHYETCKFISREEFIFINSDDEGVLTKRMHKRIGKPGYFVEQDEMKNTLTEAVKWLKENEKLAA